MRPSSCRVPSLAAVLPLALVLAALSACSSSGPTLPDGGPVPDGGTLCTQSTGCPASYGCIGNVCTPLPCGGCDSDQVCSTATNTCVPAQGAPCPTVGGCPEGYQCNSNHVCSTPCTVDTDCSTGLVCNSNTGTCAQCVFDSNCTTVAGMPRCDSTSGNCVQCLQPIDCTTLLGAGHFCDTTTNTCKAGCESNSDCNLSDGERCNGATPTTPGTCVQCTIATEATDCSVGAPACDSTGHCRECTADSYCGPATPRCDTTTDTCVACLPANNATGADCGFSFVNGGARDPHDEEVCDPTAMSCVSGCATDANCGCPRQNGTETNCIREFKQEHCDPTKTTSADATGPTEGACVECVADSQCFCKVKGNANATDPSTGTACSGWLNSGAFNGSRCVADVCVQGCDTDADCPANKLCSLSGATAHQCVECSCANATINDNPGGPCVADGGGCGWCDQPLDNGQLGGCSQVIDENDGGSSASAPFKVCDVQTGSCRLKRQNEACSESVECGDTNDPSIGQCIPGIGFCVKYTGVTSPAGHYCSPDETSGRCDIPCTHLGSTNDACVQSSGDCPSGSTCSQATATTAPLHGISSSGEYCASAACTN